MSIGHIEAQAVVFDAKQESVRTIVQQQIDVPCLTVADGVADCLLGDPEESDLHFAREPKLPDVFGGTGMAAGFAVEF